MQISLLSMERLCKNIHQSYMNTILRIFPFILLFGVWVTYSKSLQKGLQVIVRARVQQGRTRPTRLGTDLQSDLSHAVLALFENGDGCCQL